MLLRHSRTHSATPCLLAFFAAFLFTPVHFVSANSASGWVSLASENLGNDASCGPTSALYDFQTMAYDAETPVTVTNISVRVYVRGSSPTQFIPPTVSGTSLTGATCVNIDTQGVEITVTGGPNHYDFYGVYYWETTPAAAYGKRMRAHIHLRPRTSPTQDIAHLTPALNAALQNEAPYEVALNSFSSIYGASGTNRISFFLQNPSGTVSRWEIPVSGGTGVYTVPPRGVSAEGVYFWAFYLRMNGSVPLMTNTPTSPNSGWQRFIIDRTPPTMNIYLAHGTSDQKLRIHGNYSDALSGVASAGVFFDGVAIAANCASGSVSCWYGPFAPGSVHTYSGYAIDMAGNRFDFPETTIIIPPPVITAGLSAIPSVGGAPLSTVLTATTTGNAIGPTNFSFWWDCNDPTTNVGTANATCGTTLPPPPPAGTCVANTFGATCAQIPEHANFAPTTEQTYQVESLAVDTTGVYAGGMHWNSASTPCVAGYMCGRIGKYDISSMANASTFGSGGVVNWGNPYPNGKVTALTVDNQYLYSGGGFAWGSAPCANNCLAIEKRDKASGALVTSFDGDGILYIFPPQYAGISSILTDANYLYVGGMLSGAGACPGVNACGVFWKRNISTGASVATYYLPYGSNSYLVGATLDGNYIYALLQQSDGCPSGGYPISCGRIVKLDKTTGVPVASFGSAGSVLLNPTGNSFDPSGIVVDGGAIYITGQEHNTTANGGCPWASYAACRWRTEKYDATTGALVPAFGSGGVLLSPYGGQSYLDRGSRYSVGLGIDASDIYILGFNSGSNQLEKRNKVTGALVSGFGAGGTLIFNTPPMRPSGGQFTKILTDTNYLYLGGYQEDDSGSWSTRMWRVEKRDKITGALVWVDVPTTYTATGLYTAKVVAAQGTAAPAEARKTINVGGVAPPPPPPTATVSYSPANISSGGMSTPSYTSTNTTSCDVYVSASFATLWDIGNKIVTGGPTSFNWGSSGPYFADEFRGVRCASLSGGSGVTWAPQSAVGNDDWWEDVAYGNGIFVAVGSDFGGNRIITSPDGINWTSRTVPSTSYGWNDVAFGNGLFVAVSGFGPDRVMTSPDGINWTIRSAAGDNDEWDAITYANGLFVAVGHFGDHRVMTSPDGINWTGRSAAGNNDWWYGVSYGNGVFVAVGASGDRAMTSPDGINWTVRSAAGDNDFWYDVIYGNGLFVAVATGASGDHVMTSPDGINWTTRSAAGDNDTWLGVTYGNGVFAAVSCGGSAGCGAAGDRVMTSPDGINWTVRSAAGDNDAWRGITYGNGIFVAVGAGTTAVDHIMTSGGTVEASAQLTVTAASAPDLVASAPTPSSAIVGVPITFTSTISNTGNASTDAGAPSSWGTSYLRTDPDRVFTAAAFDADAGVLYAGVSVSASIYRCNINTRCDSSTDWTLSFDSPDTYIESLVVDAVSGTVYAGTSLNGLIYRCPTSSGCDAQTDWSQVFDSPIVGSIAIRTFTIDHGNRVLYAAAGFNDGIIYRCVLTTGCDAQSDWSIAFDTTENDVYSIVYDPANAVLYAGTYPSAYIYRCPTSNGCDAATDWSVAYDSPQSRVLALEVDTTNEVLYAGTRDNGVIYRCPTSTDCDAAGDWSVAYDSTESEVMTLGFDGSSNAIYAGTYPSAFVYRCSTSTDCDAPSEWTLFRDIPQINVHSFSFAGGSMFVGTGSGSTGIIYRYGPGPTFRSFFQVASAPAGGGTITDLAPSTVNMLAAGSSEATTSPAYTFTAAGTYSVRACADKSSSGDTGTITESDEGNNCGPWTDVVVSSSGPSITTQPATGVTTVSATLNATLVSGAPATGWFRYGTVDPGICNNTFGTQTSTRNLNNNQSFNRSTSGLVPNTTYYFCAIAQNAGGLGFGSVLSFTTPVANPRLRVTPAQQDFGNVYTDTTDDRNFTVENIGDPGSILYGAATSDNLAYFTCVSGCDYSVFGIPEGASRTVTIRFAPGSTLGFIQGNITFTGTNIVTPPTSLVRPVYGNGVLPISVPDLNFGNVIISRPKDLTVTVTNYGSVSYGGDDLVLPPDFTCIAGCPTVLTPGSHVMTIRFTPSVLGDRSGTARLLNHPTVTFQVSGVGVPPTFRFQDQ